MFVADAFWLEFEVFSSQSGPSGSRGPSGPSSGGKVLKLSMLMGALILEGFLQDALDAQVVLRGGVAAVAATEQVNLEQVNPD